MSHLAGEGQSEFGQLDFDRRVSVAFHGSKISSDGGLLLFRELNDVLGLHDLIGEHLQETRTGHNRLHSIVALSLQSIFGRLAGCEEVNDADRLVWDPVMRQVVGGRGRPAAEPRAPGLWRLRVSGRLLGQNPPGAGQSGMASRRVIPSGRLPGHQIALRT